MSRRDSSPGSSRLDRIREYAKQRRGRAVALATVLWRTIGFVSASKGEVAGRRATEWLRKQRRYKGFRRLLRVADAIPPFGWLDGALGFTTPRRKLSTYA